MVQRFCSVVFIICIVDQSFSISEFSLYRLFCVVFIPYGPYVHSIYASVLSIHISLHVFYTFSTHRSLQFVLLYFIQDSVRQPIILMQNSLAYPRNPFRLPSERTVEFVLLSETSKKQCERFNTLQRHVSVVCGHYVVYHK